MQYRFCKEKKRKKEVENKWEYGTIKKRDKKKRADRTPKNAQAF